MRIHCDFCGAEVSRDEALTYELDDGELLYFCSDECLESLDYHETMQEPGRDEESAAADIR